ncbi:hypothetical protein A9264_06230 [Vibrio sp. UCD-FRSSP16_10]|uniref:FimV/HubP family polar landmark protein n=1 Tax=unclassified Vibrio TaxID=2614977 RepID=UPI0007FD7CA8|nr:hypothetical protein A9264_06230 [Vibrio sp. UCD-FRSSP16_10]OBT18003.1 hypothetical protein A9260_00225 [Vibrio sp. UCD-FRSSP16_30]
MELYRRTLIVIACLCFSVVSHAEEIRLVGPDGHLQAVPTYVVPDALDGTALNREQNKLSTQRTYGPTAIDETLWSIGKNVRSSDKQSVYKVILAIYKTNLVDFEDRNIHLLKPGSIINIPTDAKIAQQSIAEAVRILKIHAKKPSYLAKMAEKNAPTEIHVEDLGARKIQQKQIEFLQQQLQSSQQEFSSLRQNNQQLLNALGSIRTDVVQLKGQLDLETQRRASVEKTLSEQSNTPAEEQEQSSIFTNVWVIIALSVAVTALVMLLIIRMMLSIRPVPQLGNEPSQVKALNPAPVPLTDNDPEIENVEPLESQPKPESSKVVATDVKDSSEANYESNKGTVNPLDKEFEEELDKILADKADVPDEQEGEQQNDADSQNDEPLATEPSAKVTVNDDDLPEYGEKEALADAKKEARELLAEDEQSDEQTSEPEPESIDVSAPTEPVTQYKSIAEVIAEVDAEPAVNPDEEELDLRVGLDEFPDVIGKVELKDVDIEGEVSSQLDLASVYIQMNDFNHARKLLGAVIDKGNAEQQQRAQQLLDSIHS